MMYMKYLFFFPVFFAISILAPGQVILQGKVIDKADSSVAFATLIVLKNGKQVGGKISSDDGSYKLMLDSFGIYELQVTHASFAPFSKTINLNAAVNNEVIVLQEQTQKEDQVTVVGKRPQRLIERKIDRVVMNIEKSALTSGRNLLDLLSLAPGVFVNLDGTIFINGIPGARVMVNGKLLNLSGSELRDYLRNLRSDDIKSVEIIRQPGAEYDASGTGGLINFILKKGTKSGLNGTVGFDYNQGLGRYPGFSPKGTLNYHTGKLGINSSYSYLNQKDFVNLSQSRDFPGSGFYTSTTNSIHHLETNNARISTTYDINDKQYISCDYTGQFRTYTEDNPAVIKISYPDAANNTNSTGAYPVRYRSNLSDIGFNYFLTTDSLGSKFAVIADYTYYTKNTLSKNNSQTYNAGGALLNDTTFNFINPTKTKIFTIDAHYEKNFKTGTQLSIGGKAGITNIQDNNKYDIFKNGAWMSDNALAFDYKYSEKVYAAFANLSGRLAKLDYKIGLRVEKSDIQSRLTGGQTAATNYNYLSFFPDVFFKKNTNESGSSFVTLSYNRRITRPSFSQLNPYKYFVDNFTVKAGNPFLVPQFASTYSVAYLIRYKYYFELSYSRVNDMIAQFISTSPTTGIGNITNGNVGKNTIYAATMSIPVPITKKWTTNNVLVLNYTESVAQQQFAIKKASLFVQSAHTVTFNPNLVMDVNFFYIPNIVQGNTVVTDIGSFDIGIMRKFMDGRFSVKASVNHLFFPNKINGVIYYNQQVIHFKDDEQRRFASLTLNYNFNSGKAFKTRKLENSNESEKGRL